MTNPDILSLADMVGKYPAMSDSWAIASHRSAALRAEPTALSQSKTAAAIAGALHDVPGLLRVALLVGLAVAL